MKIVGGVDMIDIPHITVLQMCEKPHTVISYSIQGQTPGR